MNEAVYKRRLIQKVKERFPGCIVLHNNATIIQGMPDLLVLHMDMWAMLEVKISETAPYRPNQVYYLDLLNEMSFASVINPVSEEEVLHALQLSFESRWQARNS